MTLNLMEEKVGSTLECISTGDHFLNITPIAQTLSATINQWDYMKLRSFCRAKDTITKTKRQPTEWEKIFTNPTSDRGLISRIYKELKKHDIKTPDNPIEKWAIELNREFTAEEYRMAKRHLRTCSTSLLIREMQIKTTLRYHLTPVRMAKIKTLRTVHVGEDVEQEEHSSTVGGNADWYNHSGKQCPSTEEWIRKMWFIYTMEYYAAEKNNGIMKFAGKWMELENVILSKDEFDKLRPLCYTNADIFLLCFSVVSPTSFQNVSEKWVPEIRCHCPKAPIILVGTQSDLREDVKVLIELDKCKEKPVPEEAAKLCAEEIKAVSYIECSALTQKNLKEVFDAAIVAGIQHSDSQQQPKKSKSRTPDKVRDLSKSWWRKYCCLA
ncbi:hypothetical protein STEG23_033385 [Scotinomys teguina]